MNSKSAIGRKEEFLEESMCLFLPPLSLDDNDEDLVQTSKTDTCSESLCKINDDNSHLCSNTNGRRDFFLY